MRSARIHMLKKTFNKLEWGEPAWRQRNCSGLNTKKSKNIVIHVWQRLQNREGVFSGDTEIKDRPESPKPDSANMPLFWIEQSFFGTVFFLSFLFYLLPNSLPNPHFWCARVNWTQKTCENYYKQSVTVQMI